MSSVPGRRNVYLIGTGQDRELASTALQARGRLELSLDVVSHEALLQYYFITSKVSLRLYVQVLVLARSCKWWLVGEWSFWLIHTDSREYF